MWKSVQNAILSIQVSRKQSRLAVLLINLIADMAFRLISFRDLSIVTGIGFRSCGFFPFKKVLYEQ